jgi:hypothetical protein
MSEKRAACLFWSELWRKALVLCTVLSLALSLVTRYGIVEQQEIAPKIVKSQSLDAARQHLLKDGLRWSAPAATFVLFQPAEVSHAELPAIPSLVRLRPEDFLYIRPPPSC